VEALLELERARAREHAETAVQQAAQDAAAAQAALEQVC
jgi:hypothetical protein